MNEAEKIEVEKANDLYKMHERMMRHHSQDMAPWDTGLHNEMIIQLQVVWPIAYREINEK
jgi:hypothetical protein